MTGQPFFSIAKPKKAGIWRAAARHNLRKFQANGGSTRFDPRQSHLNVVLAGATDPDQVEALVKDRLTKLVKRPRRDGVLCVEVLFSLPANCAVEQDSFFEACVHWCASWCGGPVNIISAVLHRDEAAPHCHVLILPEVDGVLRGSEMVGGPRRVQWLHENFQAAVAVKFGLRQQPTMAEIFTGTGRPTSEDTNPIGFADSLRCAGVSRSVDNTILCRVRSEAKPAANESHPARAELVGAKRIKGWRTDLTGFVIPTFNDWAKAQLGKAAGPDPALRRVCAMRVYAMMAATLALPVGQRGP